MCGIAGTIGLALDETRRGRVARAIAHRGPDDRGHDSTGGALLLHSRLSILDLSCAGHQPMVDRGADGTAPNTVVFNGELYNYRELHGPLAAAGLACHTGSDTEVLLKAYRAWGDRCVERFRGMWAFCLTDPARGIALLSRDRFGIKPLYLYRPASGGLAFASEVRALLALGPDIVAPVVDPGALEGFFAQGAVQGDAAIIRGVTLLAPATNVLVDLETGREVRRHTYWQLPAPATQPGRRAEAVEELGTLAREAVDLHLVTDVPAGLFLSGGIDSAALLALAAEHRQDGVRTINVGVDVAAFDESDAAVAMAARFGARHTQVRLTGADLLTELPSALAAMDQPSIDGINVYVVSRATREAGLTVALSGLGSDELFGGYSSFREVPRAVRLRRWLPFAGAFAPLLERAWGDRAGAKLAALLRRGADPLGAYLLRRELFLPDERRALQALPPGADPITGLDEQLLADARTAAVGLDPVTQVSAFELGVYMQHTLLRDGDAFSMAAPIEYRVPFLDHRLAEAVFRLPGEWKLPDPRPKPLLLDLVGAGRLPDSVWKAPKRGFSFPWGAWLGVNGPLHRTAADAARDTAVWSRLGLRPAAVSDVWRRFVAGDRRVAPTQVLALVVLRDFAERHGLRAA